MKHFTNRGFKIMWRGDQDVYGVAFVAADDAHAKYVEVRYREGDLDTERPMHASAARATDAVKHAFINWHVDDTVPPAYCVDVALVCVHRSAKRARVKHVEGEVVSVLT